MEDYMKNIEIKNAVKTLQEKKKEILGHSFELNQEMINIKDQINALQNQCTHMDEDGTFAINQHSRCRYCGKRME